MTDSQTGPSRTVKERRVALVTGGTGFIGSHLVQRLVTDGWSVHAIVRPSSDLTPLSDCIEKIVLHVHDGSTLALEQLVRSTHPDVTFHLAALSVANHDSETLEALIRDNILFSTQLMEAVARCDIKNFVNTGTFWQHYENREYSPTSLYAATKQAFEAIVQYYVEVCACRTITLTLFDSYGPRDPREKIFSLLSKAAASAEPLPMSPGEQFLDLVYIDDIIDAYLLAAERLLGDNVQCNEHYAVSSGQPIKLQQLIKLYESITNIKLAIEWGGRPYREREIMKPWDAGVALPGWYPKIPLDVGILRTLEGAFKNGTQGG